MHNVKETLHKKGVDIDTESRIYEICNPMRAKYLLEKDFQLLTGLPCRVSIWKNADGTAELGLIDAQAILGLISQDPEVIAYATEVNEKILDIVTSTISS